MHVMSLTASAKRKQAEKPAHKKAPMIPHVSLEKSREISNRGRQLLIDRYAGD